MAVFNVESVLLRSMARPPDIGQLLANLQPKGKGDDVAKDSSAKPKFLSKEERHHLLCKQRRSTSETQNISELKRKVVPELEDTEKSDHDLDHHSSHNFKKPRFQFEWDEHEDTLAEYRPIVSLKVGDLLRQRKDRMEEVYMGKHWTEKTRAQMTSRDWRIFKEDFGISIKGGTIEHPLRSWNELEDKGGGIVDTIVTKLKYNEPMPIQRAAIPNVCNNRYRDLLGVASTGSGKTLAFLIPILMKFNQVPFRPLVLKKIEGPLALILAPTRELAQQIRREAQNFIDKWGKSCKVVSIVGGHAIEEITYELSGGVDILVATPGRLIDCLENHLLSIDKVETLVFDEADKMIDLGFEDQVTNILNKFNITRSIQTMMFTATMTPSIEKIANGYLKKPAYVTISGAEGSAPMIQQIVEYMPSEEQRFKRLVELLPHFMPPIIIFITYKKTADWLAQKFFDESNHNVTVLHGSKSQEQREHSLQLLRMGKAQIMIATNVAARGLDVPNVSLVINFQAPKHFEDYVHRIGRTGRAGNEGTAITFLNEEEPAFVEKLYNYVQKHDPTNKNTFARLLKEKYKLGSRFSNDLLY
ncbi:related to Pre-mRNA-splicing ATP-dependent RNA helicase PRP28 [Zygosaccharomyces bailii ISA1307]|nr:related to Pre-mRNA-splicing ATP-dependent RNA helicase PRP28 [Zygosaccharomyces bailii ISA1307]